MSLIASDQEWVGSQIGCSFRVESLTPDASARRYYRILASDNSTCVLVKENPFDPSSHSFINMQQHYQCSNISVPKIIAIEAQKGLILQQDLGDISLNQWLNPDSHWDANQMVKLAPMTKNYKKKRLDHIPQQMDLLVQLQKMKVPKIWGSQYLTFDQAKFSFEWGWSLTHLIEPRLSLTSQILEEWLTETGLISDYLADRARVFVHRDLHSRNIMMVNNQMYLIDFQDSRWGSPYYDLVSLIFDSYLPLDQELEANYLENYNSKSPYAFDQKEYTYQAIQRTLKACGSFASFSIKHKDDRYLPYIKPTLLNTLHLLNAAPELTRIKCLVEQLLAKSEFL